MKIDVVMPKMGESITEGTIIEWRKKVGDSIAKDEILLEIGTDKVDSEIPSPHGGTIVELLAEPNDVVEVGIPIARIETDAKPSPEKPAVVEKPEPTSDSVEVKKDSAPKTKPDRKAGRFFTPVVIKMAQEAGISIATLESISGSGKSNRVTKKDLQTYLQGDVETEASHAISKPQPSSSPQVNVIGEARVEMDHMRKRIAEHMRQSLDTSAHVYVVAEVDMSPIVSFVARNGNAFKEKEGFSLTYTPFIIQAVVQALKEYPEMNASLDGSEIVYHKHINIGMAVAVEKGLMVPSLFHCEELNFLGLCRKVTDLATRTRKKQISPDELQGSTFSISNFGVFNVTMGMPIINQPNVGILGVGTIKKRPVVIESDSGDTIGIRSIMYLSLGMDHRLIDGAGGSRFIDSVRKNLENVQLEGLL